MKHTHVTSLFRKLFSSFITNFLILVALVDCIVSYLFSARQYREINQQAENNLGLVPTCMSKYINDIDDITKALYYHSYFQSKSPFDSLSPYDQNQMGKEIGQLLRPTTYSRDDFEDLLILTDKHVLYFNSIDWYQYFPTINPLNTREWYRKAIALEDCISIVPPGDSAPCDGFIRTDSFCISRKFNNIFQPEQANIIMVNLKTDTLEILFSSLTSRVPLMTVSTNEGEKLIYSDTDVNQNLVDSLASPRPTFNHKSWNHYSQPLSSYPLAVHVLLSSSYIAEQIAIFMMTPLLCYILDVCIACILFRKNNQWIKNPTYRIKSILREPEGGNLITRYQPISIREFNEIGSSVNTMAFQLQEKIENEYELTLSQKNLQFQALQSQIRPHFTINIIYSLITLNQIGEQELLNDSFYSFVRLLRYVLNKDSNTTIGKELDFLNDYCSLYLSRFGNRLSYDISCPESLRGLSLPELLMQLLAESVITHGMGPSETSCCLDISITEHAGTIYIIIEDNGVGSTQEQLSSSDSVGIGSVEKQISIQNPQARLRIYRVGGSTVQTIVIPE